MIMIMEVAIILNNDYNHDNDINLQNIYNLL